MRHRKVGHFLRVIGSAASAFALAMQAIFYLREAIELPVGRQKTIIFIAIALCGVLTVYSACKSIRHEVIKGVGKTGEGFFRTLCMIFMPRNRKAEKWLVSLSFWVPRGHREAMRGDILEDCAEMRRLHFTERRIRIHVLWQLAIAVIALWPQVIGSAVAAVAKRIWSVKK